MPRQNKFSCLFLSHLRRLLAGLFCIVLLLGCACAQDNAAVPQLVKFSGTISGTPAGTVGVIFALYKDQTGGAPLWQEVQNITIDASGHYSSLLGARSATGIPLELFANGEARWLGVQPEGQPEQPRVLLVSVPYALKASDSETLGGLPASAFLRADAVTAPPSSTAPVSYINTAAVTAAVHSAVTAAIAVSSPTLGYVPYFYDAGGDLKNSSLFQATSGNLGIGTTTPAALLTLVGNNPSLRIENYSNTAGNSPNFNFYSGRGTAAKPLATQSGDNLGQFAAAGYNGSAFPGSKVKVAFLATQTWDTTSNGTAITFATTKNGATSLTERMRIDNTGNVGIGTTTPGGAASTATRVLLEVNGNVVLTKGSAGSITFQDGTKQTTAGLSGVVAIADGGTGKTTQQTAINALTGTQKAGTYLRSNGSNATLSAIEAADVPTLNQSTTGTAANVTGVVAIANGGTGSKTQNFVDLSTSQTIGGTKTFSASPVVPTPASATQSANKSYVDKSVTAALANVAYTNANNNFSASQTISGDLYTASSVVPDQGGTNTGSLYPGLNLGGGGEGIASNRANPAAGTNQYGLDFYTNSTRVMSITNSGVTGMNSSQVGINTASPNANVILEVDGVGGAIFGDSNGASKEGAGQSEQVTAGVWGDTADTTGYNVGVLGTADSDNAGIFANNATINSALVARNDETSDSTAPIVWFGNNSSKVSGGAFNGGSCTIDVSGNLTCSGTVTSTVMTQGERQVALHAMQSPENWFEDFGSGTLSNGVATVTFDRTFAQTVNTAMQYHVFLTPNGDCKGLYVAQKSGGSFEVRELGGGKSNVAFDYRIVAKRVGYETARLEDMTERINRQKAQHEKMHRPARPSAVPKPKPSAAPKPAVRAEKHSVAAQPR